MWIEDTQARSGSMLLAVENCRVRAREYVEEDELRDYCGVFKPKARVLMMLVSCVVKTAVH